MYQFFKYQIPFVLLKKAPIGAQTVEKALDESLGL